MKTPEEIIKQRYPFYNPDIAQKDIEINAEAAIELMQEYAAQCQADNAERKWINIEARKPIATESGDWDGLKSQYVFVMDKDGKCHVAVMYEGNLDGGYFYEFCDDRDFEVKNVKLWMEIPYN
jgi:hypothetical protein